MSSFELKTWMQTHLDRIEMTLSEGIQQDAPAELGQAMRYAVLDGGKRLRPLQLARGGCLASRLRH